MAKCRGMLKPLPTSYTKVSTESFYWVFGSFFADILSRQTEKFWNRCNILLLTYLAPEFWRLSICSGVVVITTAHLHSTKPELRFCAGSNPTCSVSEIHDGEDLTMVPAGNKAKRVSLVNHTIKKAIQFIICLWSSFASW